MSRFLFSEYRLHTYPPVHAAKSGGSLPHHPKIVLGVLIEVLGLDDITIQCRFARERNVPLIVPVRVAACVVPLPVRAIALTGRRLSSLGPRVPVSHVHSVDLPTDVRHAPLMR
jgi:hypothetical protein